MVVLNYRSKSAPSNRRAIVLTPLIGIGAGALLTVTGYVFLCGAVVLGFVVGVLCARLAVSHRIVFGVVGNAIAAVSCLSMAMFHKFFFGDPNDPFWRYVPEMLAFSLAMLCVPGLIGGWSGLPTNRPAEQSSPTDIP